MGRRRYVWFTLAMLFWVVVLVVGLLRRASIAALVVPIVFIALTVLLIPLMVTRQRKVRQALGKSDL